MIREQYLNGSPVYEGKHVQLGICAIVWHSAFGPQTPGQGSLHLLLTHALLAAQSEFTRHSGWQASYGLPKYSGKHEQEPAPFCSRQIALMPHGDGIHGVTGSYGFVSILK